jgi:hypothetical protein
MKKFFIFLIGLFAIISFESCTTAVYAQTDDEVYVTSSENSVDYNVIISYGVPVYDEANFVMYYVYKGWYYYPYWITDRYYFHVYRHPLSIDYYRRWYRPVPRDFHRHFHDGRVPVKHRPHFKGNRHDNRRVMPNHHRGAERVRPNVNHRPNVQHRPSVNHRPSGNFQSRPNVGMSRSGGGFGNRPSSPQRSSTRMGGRR